MDDVTNPVMPSRKQGSGVVSILDESLFTGDQKQVKLYCSVDNSFISIAAVDPVKTRFTGFEGYHFDRLLTEEQLAQKISSLTLQSTILKKVDFRNVSVQFSGSRFTLIPSAIFRESDAQEIFYFNHRKNENEKIHFDSLKGLDTVNVFSVPASWMSAFHKLFEKFSVHHHLTSLIAAARLVSPKHSGHTLFMHVHSGVLDVIVLADRKLVFANSFAYRTTEDGIYFAMMVTEQLSLNAEKTEVIVSGEVDQENNFIQQLKKYMRHITFGERMRAATFTYGFDEVPQPYYHGAFSHILCES